MTIEQLIIIGISVVILALFIWGKWRFDIIAAFGLVLGAIFGVIPISKAFEGFSHPATITVGLVFILSYALSESGAIEIITRIINPLEKFPSLYLTGLVFIAAVLSMFINNIGALALLMPVALNISIRSNKPVGAILMPLSFGSILGGMVTLIGTPPNIIVSSYRADITGQAFGMFDFSPVGGITALAGLIFILFFGKYLLKVRKTPMEDFFEIDLYLFELKIKKDSEIINKTIIFLEDFLDKSQIEIISIIRKKISHSKYIEKIALDENDILLVEGSPSKINDFAKKFDLDILIADSPKKELLHSKDTEIIEVVVGPNSRIDGKLVEKTRFRSYYNVNLLGLSRAGEAHRGRLKKFKISVGDVLLLQGESQDLKNAMERLGCFPLASKPLDFSQKKMAWPAILIFGGAIAIASIGLVPIQFSFAIAVLAFIILGIIPIKDIYKKIDWPIIILLGAMIPIGGALESTGATTLFTNFVLGFWHNASPILILIILLIVTMTLSDILNNAATALIMLPIAKSMAEALSVNLDSFLMAVAVGSSCAFLTPIGHQNNALIMSPGGYKFGDYWRLGLPLEILIVSISIPLILLVWPL